MERTKYMQLLMTVTQSEVPIEAIKNGFDGSWERLIAKKILRDYENGHSEATELMNYFFTQQVTSNAQAAVKAAFLITSSKQPEHV